MALKLPPLTRRHDSPGAVPPNAIDPAKGVAGSSESVQLVGLLIAVVAL